MRKILAQIMHKPWFTPVTILAIVVIGALLRLDNLSPNKIYPDSYQSLLTALNIQQYHSVVGFLGKDGMVYPDFFGWTRPGYPFLILVANLFTKNLSLAAQSISFLTGILSLPLAYFLGKTVFKSNAVGISCLLLLALSLNHAVWGGLILTEAPAVFLMLSFLLIFMLHDRVPKEFSLLYDIGSGVLLALLICTRYEYILLVLPLTYFLIKNKYYSLRNLMALFLSTFLTLIIIGSLLYPLPGSIFILLTQFADILEKLGIVVLIGVIGIVLVRKLLRKNPKRFISRAKQFSLAIMWMLALYLVLQNVFPSVFPVGISLTSALRNFFTDDVFISFSFLIGMTILLKQDKHTELLLFICTSIILLFTVYFRTNPLMERYITHLIPFLILPGGYGLSEVFTTISGKQKRYQMLRILLLLSVLVQIILTIQGIRNWGDKSWFQKSYDERAAELTGTKIIDKNALLLASFPEPYYFFTRLSTYSLTDSYPYIYIPDALNNRTIIISDDMGMRDLFPHFANFLQTQMGESLIDSFYVHENYHFREYSRLETNPVRLYKTTVGELKKKLNSYK